MSIELDFVGAYRSIVSVSVPVAISANQREKSRSATSTGSNSGSIISESTADTSMEVSTSSVDSAVTSRSTSSCSRLTLILPAGEYRLHPHDSNTSGAYFGVATPHESPMVSRSITAPDDGSGRSEERRVGKGWRSRLVADDRGKRE